jgi:hypothetical protein
MPKIRWVLGLAGVALFALTAYADRIPSSKTVQPKQMGTRGDLTVPYTTNGTTTLGVYQGVSPRVYSAPNVEDQKNPDVKEVYNLPFWGAVQSFGDKANGATPRPPGPPFPSK